MPPTDSQHSTKIFQIFPVSSSKNLIPIVFPFPSPPRWIPAKLSVEAHLHSSDLAQKKFCTLELCQDGKAKHTSTTSKAILGEETKWQPWPVAFL